VPVKADKRQACELRSSRLDYSTVHRSPVRTCECKILVRGRVTVNMRRARRGVGLDSSEVTRSCRMPRPSGGRARSRRDRVAVTCAGRAGIAGSASGIRAAFAAR
jgi:hypothetical protein